VAGGGGMYLQVEVVTTKGSFTATVGGYGYGESLASIVRSFVRINLMTTEVVVLIVNVLCDVVLHLPPTAPFPWRSALIAAVS
jgi:hypothetical protein